MSKQSTKSPSKRYASDGRMPISTYKALAGGAGQSAGSGGKANTFTFTVSKLEKAALKWLLMSMPVTFESNGRSIRVIVNNSAIGFVPPAVRSRVDAAIKNGCSARISDVAHEHVEVRVLCD